MSTQTIRELLRRDARGKEGRREREIIEGTRTTCFDRETPTRVLL